MQVVSQLSRSQLDPSVTLGCNVFHVETSSFQDNANIALAYTELLDPTMQGKSGYWKITPAQKEVINPKPVPSAPGVPESSDVLILRKADVFGLISEL